MNTRNLRFRSNRVADIKALFHSELDHTYGHAEVEAFLLMLAGEYLGWDRVQWLLGQDNGIDQSDLLRFHWALEDLHRHRPIQHIIGHTDFCGCRIKVNTNVLIPRPETEEMTSLLIARFATHGSFLRILDLCTGSGCIAIALAKAFPQAVVTAVDISAEALTVARRNAAANNVDIIFEQADLLHKHHGISDGAYDIIVSNPPYVRQSERAAMQPNVLDYDPHIALFVPDSDPLLFYRAIASTAQSTLADDGLLAVEINEALATETAALLCEHGLHPTLHTDFRGRNRWLSASRG